MNVFASEIRHILGAYLNKLLLPIPPLHTDADVINVSTVPSQ